MFKERALSLIQRIFFGFFLDFFWFFLLHAFVTVSTIDSFTQVLQCVAVRCSVLQGVEVCYSVLQCAEVCCGVL